MPPTATVSLEDVSDIDSFFTGAFLTVMVRVFAGAAAWVVSPGQSAVSVTVPPFNPLTVKVQSSLPASPLAAATDVGAGELTTINFDLSDDTSVGLTDDAVVPITSGTFTVFVASSSVMVSSLALVDSSPIVEAVGTTVTVAVGLFASATASYSLSPAQDTVMVDEPAAPPVTVVLYSPLCEPVATVLGVLAVAVPVSDDATVGAIDESLGTPLMYSLKVPLGATEKSGLDSIRVGAGAFATVIGRVI